ncbi:GNAT family N-acetyltransferase [Klebsiella pneumoniae]|uniref:GNAT family N-acetyltransferase n=1 Tax=Klebsiella pneumoniae TaxID=573 RepID=UPI0016478ED9|nr:GNAT family N-acetyltransferase [Klebsiella pneumoniae]HDT4054602.1 GNAT family N-acetyltransferase [Klebsiella pneumoniae subsp. pneumoniae]MBC4367633.1 GNAT family N-acetyltransferase [Klebsiella pneumoniae]MCQ0804380.1 GNAT family N-acetyltransferase [Klebsiella pneumoniae]WBU70818.1 GNAT family N-acetyltransferase [Klebsiella pneumoniae]HBQ3113320.1 GNAT family N-acetyltransferase [Klebsiella pneumoniae]
MKSISVRRAINNDFNELTEIWFEASIIAHSFIPDSYWEKNKVKMQETYLPMSEVYVAEDSKNIYGFIALVDNHIASIFVLPSHQGKGIGKILVNYAKGIRKSLDLNVYQKNISSVNFYESVGFKIVSETRDNETDSKEFLMRWEF